MLTILALSVQWLKTQAYGLSYQVSSSMPKGWYLQTPVQRLTYGTWVFLKPPTFAKNYLQRHHWLPNSGIMLKSIQALPGDWVCVKNHQLWINQQVAALTLTLDRHQQTIEQRPFCRLLTADEYLVLGLKDARSYDSRYFGPINRKQILAKAAPLSL